MRSRSGSSREGEPVKLALLADGSVPHDRRREGEALLAEQKRAAALIRSAAASVEAPAHVRAWIAGYRSAQGVPPSTSRTTRWRPR